MSPLEDSHTHIHLNQRIITKKYTLAFGPWNAASKSAFICWASSSLIRPTL